MSKLIRLFLLLLLPTAAFSQVQRFNSVCSDGARHAITSGLNSTNFLESAYPSCLITVFNHGTLTLSTIYSDSSSTPLSNPFTASSTSIFGFYANTGLHYDVQMSGAGMTTTTIPDVAFGSGGGGSCGINEIPCLNTPNTWLTGIQRFMSSSQTDIPIIVQGHGGGLATPSFVQATTVRTGGGPFFGCQIILPNVQAGDAILMMGSPPHEPQSVADSLGNSYTLVGQDMSSGGAALSVFIATNAAAGTDTITMSGVAEVNGCMAAEYAGIAPSNAVDVSVFTGGGAVTTTFPVGPVTTTLDNDALITIITAGHTSAAPVGYTLNHDGGTDSPPDDLEIASAFAPTPGSYSATWTGTGSTPGVGWSVILIALKANANLVQTSDLTQWESYTTSVLSRVNNQGQFVLPSTNGLPTNVPLAGALAYDSTANLPSYYNGTSWVHVGSGSGVASINSTTGAFTFSFGSGAGSCSGNTCTFTGSGSGGGSVVNFIANSASWPSWLVPSVATSTTTPTLSVTSSLSLANVAAGAAPTGFFDFAGATTFRFPIHSTATAINSGEMIYDSTNGNMHMNVSSTDLFVLGTPSGSPPTTGHCAQFTLVSAWWELTDSGAACGSGGGGITFSPTSPATNSITKVTGTNTVGASALSDDGTTVTSTEQVDVAVSGAPSQASFVQSGVAPTVATNAFTLAAPTTVSTANTVVGFTAPCSGVWTLTNTAGIMASTCTAGGGVSSFTGDGTLISNSSSTGAVTATLATATAHKFFGNNTGSTAGPGYELIGSQDWSPNAYVAGAGSVNVMTAALAPALTSLVAGIEVDILPNLANTSTTPTLNVSGLGAKTVTKNGISALAAGDYTTTAIAKFIYDGVEWQLQNPQTASGGGVTSVSFTGGLITVATATTTPALTVAGTSGGVPYFSSSSTWASSAALSLNTLVKGGGPGGAPSNSLVVDNGTTLAYSGTGGDVAVSYTSNGTTAGFVDYTSGTTSASVAPCNTASSWCVQAPAGLGGNYIETLPAPATGVILHTLSGTTITDSIITPYVKPVVAAISSATGGSGTGTVTCLTAACTNISGTYSVAGGTFTTGTFLTLVWPTTTTAYNCWVTQNGGIAYYGMGHGVATATGMTVTAGISIISVTVSFDYGCSAL